MADPATVEVRRAEGGRACRKVFRARFVSGLRSAEPAPTQPEIESSPAESRTHNQKLGCAAFSRPSHVGDEQKAGAQERQYKVQTRRC